MNDLIPLPNNEQIIRALEVFGRFALKYSIVIVVVAILLVIIQYYLIDMKKKLNGYQCSCTECNGLLTKIKKVIEGFSDSQKFGWALYLFTLIFVFAFHYLFLLMESKKTEITSLDFPTVIGLVMYGISLISNTSKINMVRKFNKVF